MLVIMELHLHEKINGDKQYQIYGYNISSKTNTIYNDIVSICLSSQIRNDSIVGWIETINDTNYKNVDAVYCLSTLKLLTNDNCIELANKNKIGLFIFFGKAHRGKKYILEENFKHKNIRGSIEIIHYFTIKENNSHYAQVFNHICDCVNKNKYGFTKDDLKYTIKTGKYYGHPICTNIDNTSFEERHLITF